MSNTEIDDRDADEVLHTNEEMARRLLDVEPRDEVEFSFIIEGEEKTTRQKVVGVSDGGIDTTIYMEECPGWNGPSISLTVRTLLDPELKPTLEHPTSDPTPVQEFTSMTVDPAAKEVEA